jgi:hypothetical protein
MGIHTHDPGRIVITVGPFIVSDYADGTFVKVSRAEDTFKTVVGADGEATRVRSRNKAGAIEITVKRGSPTNDYLSALAISDEEIGIGIVPTMVKDLNGTSLHVAPQSWVKKPAEADYGKELSDCAWTIETGNLITFVGGLVL